MSRPVPPGEVVAGAAVLAGVAVIVWPHHVGSIVPVLVVSAAAAVAVHSVNAHVPSAGWISPYKWLSPFAPPSRDGGTATTPTDIEAIEATFGGRRQRIPGGRALPPDTLRLLKPCVVAALDADGRVDGSSGGRGTHSQGGSRVDLVSPATRALLAAEPLRHPWWFHTLPPDSARTAHTVQAVLDDLDRLYSGAARSTNPPNSDSLNLLPTDVP